MLTARIATFAGVVMLAVVSAAAQTASGPTVVTIGLAALDPDLPAGAQGLLGGRGAGRVIQGDVFFDRCLTRANVQLPVPLTTTDSWRFTGRIVAQTEREAVVELEWQRTREGGQSVTEPGGTRRLTLASGDRIPIDELTTIAAPGCVSRKLALEVRFGPAGPPVDPPRVATAPGVRGGPGAAPAALGPPLPPLSYTMELTLVDSAPNRADEAQTQTLRIGSGGASFRFRPVTVAVDGGNLAVAFFASMQFTLPNQVNRGYQIFAEPQMTLTPAGSATPSPATRGQRFSAAGPLPDLDRVLTFQLPPIILPDGGATLPNRFSLRMQIRPAK